MSEQTTRRQETVDGLDSIKADALVGPEIYRDSIIRKEKLKRPSFKEILSMNESEKSAWSKVEKKKDMEKINTHKEDMGRIATAVLKTHPGNDLDVVANNAALNIRRQADLFDMIDKGHFSKILKKKDALREYCIELDHLFYRLDERW